MEDGFKKELDSLKYGLHSIEEIFNKIRVFHKLNSSIEEEDKEKRNV